MNKDSIRHNLEEAIEGLEGIIKGLGESDFCEAGYYVAMQHVYHHINTAWNSRNTSEEEYNNFSDDDFNRWRLFPSDVDMGDWDSGKNPGNPGT